MPFLHYARVNAMERRKHSRTDISVNVRLETGGQGFPAVARDVSSRGIFLELECAALDEALNHIELHFEIDTGIQVLSRRISGTITRKDTTGLAVRFSEHDILARAVIHELMYYMQLLKGEEPTQLGSGYEAADTRSGGCAA